MERIDELLSYFKEKDWFQYKNFKPYCALLRKDVPINSTKENISKEMFTQSEFYRTFCEKDFK